MYDPIRVTRVIPLGRTGSVSLAFGDCRLTIAPADGIGMLSVAADTPTSDMSCALADVYVRYLRKRERNEGKNKISVNGCTNPISVI